MEGIACSPLMRSRSGMVREDEFYLDLNTKKDFLDYYTIDNRCTDLRIKFFASIIDGKVKFVKHALNIGSMKNDYDTMRVAVNLACRFGHPQVLDSLLNKDNHQFFKAAPDNLNFVMVVIAGISEARRHERNQEPSGILDVLIKNARKSFDERNRKWVGGKIDLDYTSFERFQMTLFMELCGRKDNCVSYVIKKILEADGQVVNVKIVIKDTSHVGSSVLTQALRNGDKEIIQLLLDKMMWKNWSVPNYSPEDLREHVEVNEHIQRVLVWCMRETSEIDIDIIETLIQKRFIVTPENKIGFDNAIFMKEYKNETFVHDHFDSMIFKVIEEEKRIDHASEKLTWFDLFDLDFQTVQFPTDRDDLKTAEDYVEMLRRYFRTVEVKALESFEIALELEQSRFEIALELEQSKLKLWNHSNFVKKCWSCGEIDPDVMVCKQCREARYCDALCQDEHWNKHQQWCSERRIQIEKEREGETREERKLRKDAKKYSKGRTSQLTLSWSNSFKDLATIFQRSWLMVQSGEYYL